jgi:hypothetical protein
MTCKDALENDGGAGYPAAASGLSGRSVLCQRRAGAGRRDVPLADGRRTEGTTIGARHGALALGKRLVLVGAKGGDAGQLDAGVAADGNSALLTKELQNEAAAGGADNLGLVRRRVIRLTAAEHKPLDHL